jgi:hypothetical protein
MGPPTIASAGNAITVQVVEDMMPIDPTALVHGRGRGAYQLLGSEAWPDHRFHLTLAAWPRP